MLQKSMGLDQASVGSSIIEHAIRKRMEETGITDEESFLALLQSSQTELKAMIEEVVVPETWFFRQQEAFRLMVQHLTGQWRRLHPGRIPRLLSVPCSTGEEAYSMAMALLDAGYAAQEFHIDAIDISEQNLNKARGAVYGNGSFRGNHLDFRQRHFSQTKGGYALASRIRQSVHFHQANILDHSQLQNLGTYDVIYCRNLLIYFNQHDRKHTAKILATMLNKDGLLFVGHAETGLMWKELFVAVAHPMAFAYRLPGSDEMAIRTTHPKVQASAVRKNIKSPVTIPIQRTVQKKQPRSLLPLPPVPLQNKGNPEISKKKTYSLDEASRLADQGLLEEARQHCEHYLKENGASAQAWFLIGLIDDTRGRKEQAKDGFRKALYLDSDHYEALVHLALLLDQLGEHKAAQHLHVRIQRLSSSQKVQAASPDYS